MELLQILLLSPLNKENGYVQVPHSIQVLNQMINTFPWPGKSLCNLIQINESLTAMVCFTLIFMSTKFCVNVRDIFFPSECWKSFVQISERSKMSHFSPLWQEKKTSCFVWVLEVPQIQFQSSFIKNVMCSSVHIACAFTETLLQLRMLVPSQWELKSWRSVFHEA